MLDPDDAIGAVRELRAREGEGLPVMGSASLAARLVEQDLVDEYRRPDLHLLAGARLILSAPLMLVPSRYLVSASGHD